jgi:hypothetical protein
MLCVDIVVFEAKEKRNCQRGKLSDLKFVELDRIIPVPYQSRRNPPLATVSIASCQTEMLREVWTNRRMATALV